MITFKQYMILSEGGNAVPGVVGIYQENSIATVNDVFKNYGPLLKISKEDMAILGSTGKKAPNAISGDIDIAVSAPALLKNNSLNSFNEIMDYIIEASKKLGHAYRDLRNLGIISVGYPIVNVDGRQPNMIVQLDFMVVESVKFASWSYFSPSHLQSQLKGLYRNELNHAVAKYVGFNVTKVHDDLKPIEWDRMWFDLKSGLHKGSQTLLSPKTGKVVKSPTVKSKEHVSDDADMIVKVLYGDKYEANDILTFEQGFKAIMSQSFPHKKHRKEILQMAADGIKDKGYPVPDILANEL
jgi:hypothetical protein